MIFNFCLFRYVCQLQRITIKFCKNSLTSRGVRDFIESNLLDFSRKNPGVVIYIKPRLHRTPVIFAEYLNGQTQYMNIRNFTPTELNWWLEFMRTRSGYELSQLISMNNVTSPSVQGVWNPYLNRSTSCTVFKLDNQEDKRFIPELPSATEQLLKQYKWSCVNKVFWWNCLLLLENDYVLVNKYSWI